jgi:hypothetical protein
LYIYVDVINTERAKEEYEIIENSYMNNANNLKMNQIQILFFDNLKHIFNSYNSFYEKLEKERKLKLLEIENYMEDAKVRVMDIFNQ